jgi:hypothetical protein
MASLTDLHRHGSSCPGRVSRPLLQPNLLIQGSIFLLHSSPPTPGSDGFHLIVAFGCANFRLVAPLVNLALRSCIGLSDADFHVIHIRERVFHFLVISKAVGSMVYNLRSFSCPSFVCHFFLWGSGGPNWSRERSLWIAEQESSWQLVSRRRPPLTGANAIPLVRPRSYADAARSIRRDTVFSL